MTKTISNIFISIAAVLALVGGFWVSYDIETFVFDTTAIVAFAGGTSSGGQDGCCGGGLDLEIPVWYVNEGGGGGFGGYIPPSVDPVTCTLSASDTQVAEGEDVTFTWTSDNANNGTLSYDGVGLGNATPVNSGSITVQIDDTGTFVARFTNNTSVAVCSEVIVVETQPEVPECVLDGVPSTIELGETAALEWLTWYADSASIDNGVGVVSPVAGGVTNVSPTSTTDYTMTVTGPGGTAYCSETIIVTEPPSYGPYCGDGIVNQSWEACDGGASCTAQCQNQCVEMSFARVVVEDVQNDLGGDLTSDIFLGGSNNKIPQGVWFLVHDGISYLTDADILSYDDVPGIAIERLAGKIRARIVGSHAFPNIKEHAAGYIETFQVNVIGQENDPTPGTFYGMEKPFDGVKAINPHKDELWTVGDTKSYFFSTVTQFDDGWFTLIEEDAPICSTDPKPACTLDADPTSIIEGDSSTLSWVTLNATSATIDQGIGSVTPIATGDTDVSPTSTTDYTMTVTGPGGTAYCSATVAVLPDEPQTPFCSLSASPDSINSGDSSTLTWSTANGDTFVIDQGIGTSTPTSGGSTAVSPTITTTYTGTLTGPYGSTTCSATVTVGGGGPTPQCTLSVTPGSINTGGQITLSWTSSNVDEGTINGNVGDVSPVSGGSVDLFPSDDFEYIGTFTGPHGTTTCSATVDVQTGGCTENCGGGLDQPTPFLFAKPGDQPLAFVSLSQIPYTGFEAGPTLTVLFWFAVVLWSLGITYIVLGRRGMQLIAARVFNRGSIVPQTETSPSEVETREDEYVNGFVSASVATSAKEVETDNLLPMEELVQTPAHETSEPTPAPQKPAVDGIPEVEDVIESRAHGAGVLLSPEALSMAKTLGDSRDETLKVFGDILNEAVRTIPREDGWILLSSDRFVELKKEYAPSNKEEIHEPKSVAEVLSKTLSESVHTRLASAVLSGDRDTAFSLVRSLEKEGGSATEFVTGIVKCFDSLIRSRLDGESGDLILADKATDFSDEALQELVEVFTHALDTDYMSPFTGVKLALAQAFEVK